MTDADRKHADLSAGFFSQLGFAFVAGAFLQVVFTDSTKPAAAGGLLMTGLLLYGASHIILERFYGASSGRQ